MLRSIKDLEHYAIGATDGDIGHVKDFYFDDDAWAVRYLVVDTGDWLPGRRVLISPIAIKDPDWLRRTLPVTISRAQVKGSPDIDTHQPVSRQQESLALGYYGYADYWGGTSLWANGLFPGAMSPGWLPGVSGRPGFERDEQAYVEAERARRRNADPHLRSCNELVGYHLHASDGDVGHVAGFLLDDETWAIRWLVVETGHWWAGHRVLVAPGWITHVSWGERSVTVELGRETVKAAPPYDPGDDMTREQEIRLYEHYGRTWYGAALGSFASEA